MPGRRRTGSSPPALRSRRPYSQPRPGFRRAQLPWLSPARVFHVETAKRQKGHSCRFHEDGDSPGRNNSTAAMRTKCEQRYLWTAPRSRVALHPGQQRPRRRGDVLLAHQRFADEETFRCPPAPAAGNRRGAKIPLSPTTTDPAGISAGQPLADVERGLETCCRSRLLMPISRPSSASARVSSARCAPRSARRGRGRARSC